MVWFGVWLVFLLSFGWAFDVWFLVFGLGWSGERGKLVVVSWGIVGCGLV